MSDPTDNSEIEEMPLLDDPPRATRGSRTSPQSVTSVSGQENDLLVIGRNCRFFPRRGCSCDLAVPTGALAQLQTSTAEGADNAYDGTGSRQYGTAACQ